ARWARGVSAVARRGALPGLLLCTWISATAAGPAWAVDANISGSAVDRERLVLQLGSGYAARVVDQSSPALDARSSGTAPTPLRLAAALFPGGGAWGMWAA